MNATSTDVRILQRIHEETQRCQSRVSQAILPLLDSHAALLAVCLELVESASYWSEYDVPIGIVDRIRKAIDQAEKA